MVADDYRLNPRRPTSVVRHSEEQFKQLMLRHELDPEGLDAIAAPRAADAALHNVPARS
jgi:hypothetical protein